MRSSRRNRPRGRAPVPDRSARLCPAAPVADLVHAQRAGDRDAAVFVAAAAAAAGVDPGFTALPALSAVGAAIPASFAGSMRDDFGVERVDAIKVGLTADQVTALRLPPNTEAKAKSSRYSRFVKRYGPNAYELEAVPPETLRGWLREKLDAVIDTDRFNDQAALEKRDAATLAGYRRAALEFLNELARSYPGSEGGNP